MRERIIQEIARSVVAAGGTDNIIRALVESTSRGTGARGCSLLVSQEGDRHPVTRMSCGVENGYLRRGQIIDDHALRQISPLGDIQRKDLKELLTKGLSRAERLIIILYYYEEMTMKEIALTLGVTEPRVSQIHSNVLAKMRARLA